MPALDTFRAMAIIIVMISHLGFGKIVPGGFGVTIFFFLSGYLIISLLREENASRGTVSLKGFFFRRTIRIFPPLYITMIVTIILSLSGMIDATLSVRSVFLDTVYLTNYASSFGQYDGLPIPLWSLDVEEHFYIIFAFSYYFFLRHIKPSKAAAICFFVCVAFLILRIFIAFFTKDIDHIYYWSHTRMDSILAGGCLALWQNPVLDGKTAWRPGTKHALGALAVLILCLVVRNQIFRETLRYSLQAAALFVIFSHALANDGLITKLARLRVIQITALFSYTLYLIHIPVLKIFESLFPGRSIFLLAPAIVLLSYAYAALMYRLVEKPLAAWRRGRARPHPSLSAPVPLNPNGLTQTAPATGQ